MMWIELMVREYCQSHLDPELKSINQDLIDVIKPGNEPDKRCHVYDRDGCHWLIVEMPYKDLLAKLNGDEPTQAADECVRSNEVFDEIKWVHVEPRGRITVYDAGDVAGVAHCNKGGYVIVVAGKVKNGRSIYTPKELQSSLSVMFKLMCSRVQQDDRDADKKPECCESSACNEPQVYEALRSGGFDVQRLHSAIGTTGKFAGWFKSLGALGDEIVVGHLQADFINGSVIIPESIRFIPRT